MNKIDRTPKVLGLDISTKTIGWALFDIKKEELLELTHFSPKVKPKKEDKIEEMLIKSDYFKNKLIDYKDVGITKIIIEEPLLNSNNIRTVATLMRYNSFITGCIQPHLSWAYTRNNTLKKENFDMCDAYTCVLGYMNQQKLW